VRFFPRQASAQPRSVQRRDPGHWPVRHSKGSSAVDTICSRGPRMNSPHTRGAAIFSGPLTIALEGNGGAVYGRAEINGLKTRWNRFTASLQSSGTDPAAHLTISSAGNGTCWLNMVSLRSGTICFGPISSRSSKICSRISSFSWRNIRPGQ
jgi:hypothetical protein